MASNIQPVKAADGTIHIRTDGSVDPSSAPILNVGNVSYTFAADINGSIVVERDNIVVNGAGHMLKGAGTGNGVSLTGRSNVTLTNTTIREFYSGVYLDDSSGNTLCANRIANDNIGIELSYSSGNGVSANNITNNSVGTHLLFSSGNGISVNIVANSSFCGILLSRSSGNDMSANTITNSTYGIRIYSLSPNNSVSENTITNSTYGILLDSSLNSIYANNVANNAYGIYLDYSSNNNSVSENSVMNNNVDGISLYSSSGNSISENIVAHNSGYGVLLSSSSGNSICENTITNNPNGIFLESSSGNSISENTITNSYFGIRFDSANRNVISTNTITNNSPIGLYLSSSSGNSVAENTITNNSNGTLLYISSGNSISENTMTNNTNGILMISSCNNIIDKNNGIGNEIGISLQGSSGNSIINNNLVESSDGIRLSSSDGTPAGVASLNNSFSNNTITGSSFIGFSSWYSSCNLIDRNVIFNCSFYGMYICASSGNLISNNNVTSCGNSIGRGGIDIYGSSNNTVTRNYLLNNTDGINVDYGSSNTKVVGNEIRGNIVGIYVFNLSPGSSNFIYHNNIANTQQISIDQSKNVFWDNGYPSGGNYWSDYNGTDANHDGIGDTPYVIDTNNVDHYPLMTPWDPTMSVEGVTTWYWTSTTTINSVAVGDVDGDGQKEIVTGGTFYDSTRNVAQLVVWNSSSLAPERLTTWFWTGNTTINSVAIGDVNGDGQTDIVTGGYYFDGTRQVAQLVVWNGSSLAVEKITTWYWTGNTVIDSVALGDVDGDGQVEIVTGGCYNDGTRNVAQLVVWNGSDLSVDRLTTWYWTGNTVINSVAIGDVDADGQVEIVTGGSFFDGTRDVAQLVVWTGSGLTVKRLTSWYWTGNTIINSVAVGDVDADGQTEIVTAGYYNDGTRNEAQLVVWAGSTLTVERLTSWYWTGNTVINSVALGDADGDGQVDVVTGGHYNDGTRSVAQLVTWIGSSLAAENVRTWYWVNDTLINSLCSSGINGDCTAETVTGGAYYDGTRWNAQLIVWST